MRVGGAVIAVILVAPLFLYLLIFLIFSGMTLVQWVHLTLNPSAVVYSADYTFGPESTDDEVILTVIAAAFQDIGCPVVFTEGMGQPSYIKQINCPQGQISIVFRAASKRSLWFHGSISTRGERSIVDQNAENFSNELEQVSTDLELSLSIRVTQKVGWDECYHIIGQNGILRTCNWSYRERMFD